jgi:hypothetical protein
MPPHSDSHTAGQLCWFLDQNKRALSFCSRNCDAEQRQEVQLRLPNFLLNDMKLAQERTDNRILQTSRCKRREARKGVAADPGGLHSSLSASRRNSSGTERPARTADP